MPTFYNLYLYQTLLQLIYPAVHRKLGKQKKLCKSHTPMESQLLTLQTQLQISVTLLSMHWML